jgi:hypothetical protein
MHEHILRRYFLGSIFEHHMKTLCDFMYKHIPQGSFGMCVVHRAPYDKLFRMVIDVQVHHTTILLDVCWAFYAQDEDHSKVLCDVQAHHHGALCTI